MLFQVYTYVASSICKFTVAKFGSTQVGSEELIPRKFLLIKRSK